jgi:hypothetical protein
MNSRRPSAGDRQAGEPEAQSLPPGYRFRDKGQSQRRGGEEYEVHLENCHGGLREVLGEQSGHQRAQRGGARMNTRPAGRTGSTLFIHDLAARLCRLNLASLRDPEQNPLNFVADSGYSNDVEMNDLHVAGYGYRWIRLHRTIGG